MTGVSYSKGSEDHPSPEKLSAYYANELSPREDDEIQEHLVGCDLCTEALLDLKAFLELPKEASPREGVVDLDAAIEWRDLRKKIREGQEPRQVPIPASSPVRRFLGSPLTGYSLAAVFAAALGLSLYTSNPSGANSQVVSLAASEARVRGEHPVPKLLELPHGQEIFLTFALDVPPGTDLKQYRVVIRGAGGEPIYTQGELFPQRDGIVFTVPSSLFREIGIYSFSLKSAQGDSKPIGTYALNVTRK